MYWICSKLTLTTPDRRQLTHNDTNSMLTLRQSSRVVFKIKIPHSKAWRMLWSFWSLNVLKTEWLQRSNDSCRKHQNMGWMPWENGPISENYAIVLVCWKSACFCKGFIPFGGIERMSVDLSNHFWNIIDQGCLITVQ